MVGGRLLATPAPGPHTLTYEARTSSGVTLTDSVTFTQPTTTAVCNNNIVEPGEACDAPDLTQPLGTGNLGIAKDYCSNRCQVELDVTEYGATKNDPADPRTNAESDTFNIQDALNSAAGLTSNTLGIGNSAYVPPGAAPVKTPPTFTPPDTVVNTVFFPAGRYDISQLHPWWGTILVGEGPTDNPTSILKRLPERDRWERILNTATLRQTAQNDMPALYKEWNSANDSPLLTIKNLYLDGNRADQGVYNGVPIEGTSGGPSGEGLQHQSILFASVPTSNLGGRIKVLVEDTKFINAGSRAVQVYDYADVTLNRVVIENSWLGVGSDGGNEIINATDVTVTQTDPSRPNHIEVAIDLEPFGFNNHSTFKRWRVSAGSMQFYTSTGSTVDADDIVSTAPHFLSTSDPGTRQSFKNSSFTMGQGLNLTTNSSGVLQPADVTFIDTEFIASEKNTEEPNGFPKALHIMWNYGGSTRQNQKVTCIRCRFSADGTIDATDTPMGVYTNFDRRLWNNKLVMSEGTVSSAFRYGMVMEGGGTWEVTGTDFQNVANNVLDHRAQQGSDLYYNVLINTVRGIGKKFILSTPLSANNTCVEDGFICNTTIPAP